MKVKACSSYIQGSRVCRSGFFSMNAVCMGLNVGCTSCGSTKNADLPNCQKDDLPDHFLNEDGSGIFTTNLPQPKHIEEQ